jgi:acyl carrier protein
MSFANDKKQRVLAAIEDILEINHGVRPMPGQTLSNDLGMDSLDIVEFSIKLEQQFSIIIPDKVHEDFDKMSVDKIASVVADYI